MRRLGPVYLLFVAILVAAGGLAFYTYSFSGELSVRDRNVIFDTMRELAEEKVVGIESKVLEDETLIFDRADIDNLVELQELMESESERPPVASVFILDDKLQIVPGGAYSVRSGKEGDEFREFFQQQVLPSLGLEDAVLGERVNHYGSYDYRIADGRPFLFSSMRRLQGFKSFYVVVEADLNYIIANIFPQFFQVRSPRLYQVVDERGDLRYGHPFTGVPESEVVEWPFSETVTGWKLRVAQKDRRPSRPTTRKLVDMILIGSALTVIIAGMGFMLLAIRRERRANELKSEFISNVSHELKTPLSIISMFGELLAMGRTKSSEQATEYAEIIQRESVRLSRLIDNVLDFAKIEKGVEVYEFAEADLAGLVERAAELSRHRLDRAGMTMSVDIEKGLPDLLLDVSALTLATLNLIDNAIKYGEDGERLEVRLFRAGGQVVLEVQDFGPGVAEQEKVAIFERFYRAQAVRLKPIRGSGIGLSLVKHVAEAHGGGVSVDSVEGEGATFRLWIPAPAAR